VAGLWLHSVQATEAIEGASMQSSSIGRGVDDASIARIVTRLSSEYALRAFQLLIDAYADIRAGLLLQAIHTANIEALVHTREGRSAAGPDGIFPDEMRRPISIARLTDSTSVPFESTRRIVQRLIDAGHCRRVAGGVIVPRATVGRPATIQMAIANLGYVRRFVRDLQAVGLDEAVLLDGSPSPSGAREHPAYAGTVAIVSAEYVLRVLRLLAEIYGDVRAGLVAQTIVTANTAHLDAGKVGDRRYASIAEPPPDEVRRPISAASLAASLRHPHETMRAQVGRLIAAGICVRAGNGLIVPQAVMEGPLAVSSMLTNVGYVRKFMRDLHVVGFDSGSRPTEASGPGPGLPRAP
jgi:hypothetical protein